MFSPTSTISEVTFLAASCALRRMSVGNCFKSARIASAFSFCSASYSDLLTLIGGLETPDTPEGRVIVI